MKVGSKVLTLTAVPEVAVCREITVLPVCVDTPVPTRFVQKYENEIPGLFQDNSRTFFQFSRTQFH